jgi:hypothetical protein
MEQKEAVRRLRDFFDGFEKVKLAYLFGSSAAGRAGKLSDVDIAVLLDERLTAKERLELELELISCLSSILKTDKIDLVVMNEAPLPLKYNIIKKGIILKSADETLRVKKEAEILSRYLDRKYFEERRAKEAIKRIARHGLK